MFTKINSFPNASIICMFLLLAIVLILDPSQSFATPAPASGGDTAIETTMCTVLNIVQGKVGKGIAAFAIIFMGIALFMGKVSWSVAIATALGIGAIFGAGSIVDTLSGNSIDECDGGTYSNVR